MELRSITTDLTLPRHALDSRLSRYRGSRDPRTALEIWLTTPSPTGSFEENVQRAAEVSGRGFLHLASRTTISPDGLPLRSSSGPEAAADEWLERIEGFQAATYGILLANELRAIRTEYGTISAEALGDHLAARFGCDVEKARSLSDAISSFWDGRFSDAGRAAFPLVEAGARGLLLALGEPLFRIETGNAEGRFPGLETYADRLEQQGFDPDWLRTMRNPVATLRNALAHGHRLSLRPEESALLIRMAGLLVVLTPPKSAQVDRAEVEARLRDPIGAIAILGNLRRRWRRVWVTIGLSEELRRQS